MSCEEKLRCAWCCDGGIVQRYHDKEWGIPLHDDGKHFEYLLMEAMQCGLSWTLMLKKREIFRRCFDGFDFRKIAGYTEDGVQRILNTEGMIRSRGKILAVIGNARAFLKIIEEHGSFDRFLWGFSQGRTYVYKKHQEGQWETKNQLSDEVSSALRRYGFRYLGSVTVYSHLQACGMINDHDPSCFLYEKVNRLGKVQVVEE